MFPYKYSIKPEYLENDDVLKYISTESKRRGICNSIEPIETTRSRRNMRLVISTIKSTIPVTR